MLPRGSKPIWIGRFIMKLIKENASDNPTGLLGKGVEVTGDIIFSDRLHVEGKVVGKLISENGTLIIGATGRVEAQVEVSVCVVLGILNGNADAKSRIEIHKGGRVNGDLATPVLIIEEGAVFNGAVEMGQQANPSLVEGIRPKDNDEKVQAKGA
jgi:cytoskeletal protein CcmA (bactofilin family)